MKSSIKDQRADYLSQSEHYEQLSDLLKKSYQSTSDTSLYVEIDQINQWVYSDSTKPLLIASKEFGGTKTLLCEFIKQMEKQRPKSIIISQFASVTPYYSEILYKITMQLRTHLNINQKVQLNEEKLRQYFSYWLEIADDRIEKDYLGYSKQEKMLLIVLIEGVDKVVDNKNQYVRPSFWLPDLSLKNIKVIYTAQAGSTAADCLLHSASRKIQYLIPECKVSKIKETLYKQNPKLRSFIESTHLGDLKIASKILNSHPKLEIPPKSITFQQFFSKFIKYASTFIDVTENIYKMLGCLIWSKKGISKNTLRRSFRFSEEATQKFLATFQDMIVGSDKTYLILSRRIRQYITKMISSVFKQEQSIKKKVHMAISKALRKQANTLSNLEELIYQLTCSQSSTELKQLLSRVQNFLVLYTPLTKHLLCMCWFQLQIQFQYDPVFQYNKAIERFLNHYYPSPEDTFKIIFQLSLFFKEYSEFENSKTPQFRHPPIRGEIEQLKEISIYDEILHMNMYQKCKVKSKESFHKSMAKTEKEKDKTLEHDKTKQLQTQVHQPNDLSISRVEAIEGKQVQKLNVRIKFHQDKFKNLYLEEMEPYVNQYFVVKKNSLAKEKQLLEEDSDDSENQIDQTKIDMEKMKKCLLLKRFSDYCEEQYHRHSQKRSFYYYKQWIWMQFPWICQSLNSNFSELIEKCMKSPTEYMSIALQSKLISDAVKIAKIAKQNKRQIYDNNIKSTQESKEILLKSSGLSSCNGRQVTRSNVKSKTVTSKCKPKVDISKIEQQLHKNAKPKRRVNNQSSIFMTDLSLNQSYAEDKQNTSIPPTCRLPNILKASNLVESKIEKNIEIVDTREYSMLVSRYDELKFENEQLVNKIQSIQFSKQSLKANNKENRKQSIMQEIEEIKEKKSKIMKNYATQEQLRAKLEMIVKLCDINKSHGSESADLNNFLSSLKLMFKIEQENLENINQQAKKILQESKASYKQIKQEKSALISRLKKEKAKFERSLSSSVSAHAGQKGNNKSKHQVKRKKNESYKEDGKKISKLDKQIEQINAQLQALEQHFGFSRDQRVVNEGLLDKFEQKIDKLNQIQWKLSELIEQNANKQKQRTQLEQRLNVCRGHREHEKQLKHRQVLSIVKQNLHKTQERKKCLQKCFGLIQEANAS